MINSINNRTSLERLFPNMKFKALFLIALSSMLYLSGCGKDAELEKYNEEMTTFTENISDIKLRMDDIDPNSEEAVSDLLECLDELEIQFIALADMEVPKDFASIESLADEASSYMTEAVMIYHEVFEADEYDAVNADVAAQNYDRAMMRLSYISTLLQGELPEGDNIIITEEEALDFEPVTDVE